MQPAFPFPSSDWRGRTACHMTGWPHGIQTSNMLKNSLISYAQAVRFLSRNLVLNSSKAPGCLVTYSDSEPLLSSATSADMQHDADHRCESRFVSNAQVLSHFVLKATYNQLHATLRLPARSHQWPANQMYLQTTNMQFDPSVIGDILEN